MIARPPDQVGRVNRGEACNNIVSTFSYEPRFNLPDTYTGVSSDPYCPLIELELSKNLLGAIAYHTLVALQLQREERRSICS